MASSPIPMTASNPSGITPTGQRVIVEVEISETERRMKAMGLDVPDSTKERDHHAAMYGRVLAVSPDVRFGLAPGQRITWGRYAGTMIEGVDGEPYRVIDDNDVKGIYHG